MHWQICVECHTDKLQSYIFRDRTQNITARQVRAKGAVAIHRTPMASSNTPSAPDLAQSYIPSPITPTKSSNPFRILTSERRQSLLPSYHTTSSSPVSPAKGFQTPTSRYSRATDCTKKKVFGIFSNRQSVGPKLPVNVHKKEMEISAPMGVNPQFAHLVRRPDSAMHPSRTGESDAFRWRPVS